MNRRTFIKSVVALTALGVSRPVKASTSIESPFISQKGYFLPEEVILDESHLGVVLGNQQGEMRLVLGAEAEKYRTPDLIAASKLWVLRTHRPMVVLGNVRRDGTWVRDFIVFSDKKYGYENPYVYGKFPDGSTVWVDLCARFGKHTKRWGIRGNDKGVMTALYHGGHRVVNNIWFY